MAFLAKATIRQAEKMLGSQLQDGETVLMRELVAETSYSLLPRGLMGKRRWLDVTATTHGLWFRAMADRKRGVVASFRYCDVAYVAGSGSPLLDPMLEITTHNGEFASFDFPHGDSGLVDLVKDRLLRLDPFEEKRIVEGIEVGFSYMPWRPECMSYWQGTGEPSSISTDLESAVTEFRHEAGETILTRARDSAAALDPPVEADERDWSTPVLALMRHLGDFTSLLGWTIGAAIDADGSSWKRVLGCSENALYMCQFESFGGMTIPRSPQARVHPYWRIADWEDQRDPAKVRGTLVRLLVLEDGARYIKSLEEIMRTEPQPYKLQLLGVSLGPRHDEFLSVLIEQIKEDGAFNPGSRAFHPLQ